MSEAVPAVVVGGGLNGLGVARSLARAKVPTWLLDSDPHRPEMRTRAATPLAVRALHGEALVEDLVQLATAKFRGARPVLLLTQEEGVRAVSRYRERLSGLYRFTLPAQSVVDTLMHKEGFQRRAEQLGGAIPPSVHIHGLADLPALQRLKYPVVIKPGAHAEEYSRHFRKAYRVDSAEQGIELLRRILPVMADVVVQEWIDGPDSSIYFCLQYVDREDRVTASFTGRKIRSWPPQVGGTASCVGAPEADAELSAATSHFFRAAGVIGMASMEYKRDSRSGEWRMVEPTIGRTDYQEEVATLNGVNLPHAAWCAELGLPFPKTTAAGRPVVWRVRTEDARSAAAQGQCLAQGCPRGAKVADALCRWRDPGPCVAQKLQHSRRALRTRACRWVPGLAAFRSKP